MKTQRKLLLVALVLVVTMVVLWAANILIPIGPRFCPIHDRASVTERVSPLPYRVTISKPPGYYEAAAKLFPNANEDPVHTIPLTPWVTRRYCPLCREAGFLWRRAAKPSREV